MNLPSLNKLYETIVEASYNNSSGDKFWGNVGAGVLVFCSKTKRFLIQKRGANVNEPNTWGVIGGAVQDKKNKKMLTNPSQTEIEKTAKEELKEETGYNGPLTLTPVFIFRTSNNSFSYHNFIGIVPSEFEINPELGNEWESSRTMWVSPEELKEIEPKHFGLKKLIQDPKTIKTLMNIYKSKEK